MQDHFVVHLATLHQIAVLFVHRDALAILEIFTDQIHSFQIRKVDVSFVERVEPSKGPDVRVKKLNNLDTSMKKLGRIRKSVAKKKVLCYSNDFQLLDVWSRREVYL